MNDTASTDESDTSEPRKRRITLFDRYCNLVLGYPWTLILSTVFVNLILGFIGLYYHNDAFTLDPGKGFETRKTTLSEQRLALMHLHTIMARPSDIFNEVPKRRTKRANEDVEVGDLNNTDYLDYGTGVLAKATKADLNDACAMYGATGDKLPFAVIEYMAKLIFEVNSFDELFTLSTMKKLCELDDLVDELRAKHNETNLNVYELKRSYNLPYYALCFDYKVEKQCDQLTEENVENLKTRILHCRNNTVDPNCNFSLNDQLYDYILPLESFDRKPMHVAAIVPVNIYASKSKDFYDDLLEQLSIKYDGNLKLKGAFFDQKVDLFERVILDDIKLGILSALLVLFCFFNYSRSFVFTLVVFAAISFSLSTAYFMYTVVFGLNFYPFVNLLALVLMISIGADDAFLLLGYYRDLKKNRSNTSDSNSLKEELVITSTKDLIRSSLSHSLLSMFVTSITTAVAFYSNYTSDVIVIKCFGVYAGTTVALNYVLVLLLLPAALSITQQSESWLARIMLTCQAPFSHFFYNIVMRIVSRLVYKGRILGILILITSLIVSLFALLVHPKAQLPDVNPMQYLRSSHPYEWFDDHQRMFNFEKNRPVKQVENFVIGVKPTTDSSAVSPDNTGTVSFSGNFQVKTMNELQNLKKIVRTVYETNPKNGNSTSWIDNFEKFVTSKKCVEGCCLEKGPLASDCMKIFAKRRICQEFPEQFRVVSADCPIFDKNRTVAAYYVSIPSEYKMTTAYSESKKVFATINSVREQLTTLAKDEPILWLSEPEVTKMYDLLSGMFDSTLSSVLISVGVSLLVIILSTRDALISATSIIVITAVSLQTMAVVVWLGWTINVVEATIIVLTIGLSFDYTLHYAVAHKHAHDHTMEDVILSTNQSAGVAVCNATVTAVLAGIPLVFSRTNAFYEIGCFLIIMNLISLFAAVFVFPSCIAVCRERMWWKRGNFVIKQEE